MGAGARLPSIQGRSPLQFQACARQLHSSASPPCPSLEVGNTFVIAAFLTVDDCLSDKTSCPSSTTESFSDPMSIDPITTGVFLDDLATGVDLCSPRVSTCGPFPTPVFPLGTIFGVAVPLATLTMFAPVKSRYTGRTARLP